jgi:hypothetical protein
LYDLLVEPRNQNLEPQNPEPWNRGSSRRAFWRGPVLVLPRAEQEIQFLAFDLLFEHSKTRLLPHVEHLVERAVGPADVSRETRFQLL